MSSDIVKAAFDLKAVGTVASASSDEVMAAVVSEGARKLWDSQGVQKESDTQVTVKYDGGY